jgi:transposase
LALIKALIVAQNELATARSIILTLEAEKKAAAEKTTANEPEKRAAARKKSAKEAETKADAETLVPTETKTDAEKLAACEAEKKAFKKLLASSQTTSRAILAEKNDLETKAAGLETKANSLESLILAISERGNESQASTGPLPDSSDDHLEDRLRTYQVENASLRGSLRSLQAEHATCQSERDYLKGLIGQAGQPVQPIQEEGSESLLKLVAKTKELEKKLESSQEEAALLKGCLAHPGSVLGTVVNKYLEEAAERKKLQDKLDAPKANSRNSSVRPSGDITNPQKKGPADKNGGKPGKRKQGGQPGHKRSVRKPLTDEEATEINSFEPDLKSCDRCGTEMERFPEKDKRHEQLEIPEIPLAKKIFKGMAYRCPDCGEIHSGEIPTAVLNQGLLGPNLTSFIAVLNVACHVPLRKIKEVLSCVLDAEVSVGYLNKALKKAGESLEAAYVELTAALPGQKALNIDETTLPENGRKNWVWVFRASMFAVFMIGTRSAYFLKKYLGAGFKGVIGCDHHSTYISYALGNLNAKLQKCWAHLIREVQWCADHGNQKVRAYGEKLGALIKKFFHTYHKYKETGKARYLEILRLRAERITDAALDAPMIGKAAGIAKRFAAQPNPYFTFLDHPEIEPTNNLAESSIRHVVIGRMVSQGTRGYAGQDYLKRMWSITLSCLIRGVSFYRFLKHSLECHATGEAAPSLLNLGEKCVVNDAVSKMVEEDSEKGRKAAAAGMAQNQKLAA